MKFSRTREFKETGFAVCKNHGKHKDWHLYKDKKGYDYAICKLCNRSRYKDYKKRLLHAALFQNSKKSKGVRRGRLENNLTKDFILELIQKQDFKCALSGIKFISLHPLYEASLDRIDSNKGYTQDNVQIVCVMVNIMKSKYTTEEFLDVCRRIVKCQKKKK